VNGFHRGFALGQINETEIFISLVEIMSMFTPACAQRFKQFFGHARVALHADADDGQLADFLGGNHVAQAEFLFQAVNDLLRLGANPACPP